MSDNIFRQDIEECLVDYMEDNFNVFIEDNSASEIASILIKVKTELVNSA